MLNSKVMRSANGNRHETLPLQTYATRGMGEQTHKQALDIVTYTRPYLIPK